VSLAQFRQLIDLIQSDVDDSNLKYEYENEGDVKGFETSKKSSVLSSDDEEEEVYICMYIYMCIYIYLRTYMYIYIYM
jgi:hypothetical protein